MDVPTQLLKLLDELIPDFKQEPYRESYAQMLFWMVVPSRQHKEYPGAVTVKTREMKQLFSTVANFKKYNRDPAARYFQVLRYSNGSQNKANNYTMGYLPQPWMAAVLDGFIGSDLDSAVLDPLGKRVRLPIALRSTNSRGSRTTGWADIELKNLIPVNLESLGQLARRLEQMQMAIKAEKLPQAYQERFNKHHYTCRSLLLQTRALAHQAKDRGGYSPIQYIQSQSGRLYAHGLNLQTVKREIRHAAMVGCWDYDISACHFSIMLQMAKQHGRDCPAIRHYVDHKSNVRAQIAQEVGISLGQVKKVITAVAYGARASEYSKNAIPKEIGADAAGRLYKNEVFRALKDDVAKTVSFILGKHSVKDKPFINAARKMLLPNKNGEEFDINDAKPSSKIAHLMQGVESVALEAAVRVCAKDVLLLQHDGFTTSKRIDTDAVHRAVRQATGYDLVFEEELITAPLANFDKDFRSLNTEFKSPPKPSIHAGCEAFWIDLSSTVGKTLPVLPPPYPVPWPETGPPF